LEESDGAAPASANTTLIDNIIMSRARIPMSILGDMTSSVTRAPEEPDMSRLIKTLLLQPPESYYPLMPSTLLKNIQRFTCTRRFQNVGTLLFPATSRFRYHR
jgi:hypothetical protein